VKIPRLLFWGTVLLTVAFILLLALMADAQVVQISGGSSTLYEAFGGGATLYWPTFNVELMGGLVNGVPAVDAATHFPWRGWDATLGNQAFNSTIGNAGLFTSVLGVTLTKKDLTFFAGDVQPLLGSSFFKGTRLGLRGGAGSFYRHQFKSGWSVSSLGVASGKRLTLLQDAAYHRGSFDLGAGGGRLENHSLAQARASYRFDGHLALSTNFLRTQGATFETVMAATGVGPLSVYASKIFGNRSGATYGGTLRIGIIDLGASYLGFKGSASLGTSLGERLGRHLTVREYATRSQGRWTESLGGGFTSNRFSVDVAQATFFVPYGNVPLQRSLIATLHLQVPWKSASLNLASGVTPDGKIRYGADGSTFLGEGLGGASHQGCCCCAGKFLLKGIVLDDKGSPVSGAAIRLGKDLVFTDSAGTFYLRVKRNKPVPLAVVPEEFTVPGIWTTVQAPTNAVPDIVVHIIVRRQP
jgi:hypothetical protein